MTVETLVEVLKRFLQNSTFNPNCSLLNDVRKTIETAERYIEAGL